MLLLFLISITCSHALTFYISDVKQRCFVDEYTINTVVIGTHQLLEKPITGVAAVELTVVDPDGSILLTKPTNSDEGKFTFTTKKQGKHQVCLKTTNKQAWFGDKKQALYFLRLKQGDNLEFTQAAKDSQINGLKQKINQLQQTETEFVKLQEMNRSNEDQLSLENIKINDRVFKATLIQIVVILAAGGFQIYSLRKFFAQKIYY